MSFNRPLSIVGRLANEECGNALVEFAILGPMLLVAVAFVIDFGLAFLTKMEVRNAAMAGAEYAMTTNSYDSAAITSAAQRATKFTAINVTPSQFCGCPISTGVRYCSSACDSTCLPATCTASTQGLYVQVQVDPSTPYQTVAPFSLFYGSIYVSATSTVRIR